MPAYENTEEYLNSTQIGRQIIRIRENVSDALTAIGAKGVTIPSGANSDDLADLIGAIQTGGGTPSATAHTIYFEFSDGTNTTITAYWDGTFISDAIRATVPETYNNKTVESAELDGTAWYTRPTAIWETLYEGSEVGFNPDETPPPYCWITELGDIWPAVGSVWRITFDGVPYVCTAHSYITPWNNREAVVIGNTGLYDSATEDTGEPFILYNIGYGAWSGACEGQNVQSSHSLKVERQVLS